MLGAWRLGAVALPCSEQLRPRTSRCGSTRAGPRSCSPPGATWRSSTRARRRRRAAPAVRRRRRRRPAGRRAAPARPRPALEDPALMIFTSGTAGEPRGVVHVAALPARASPCRPSTGSAPARATSSWCTAASGWSKSARNAFVAPWTAGAACLLHDARFDPAERLAIAAEHGVTVLCQSPTEYRMIAKRASLDGGRPAGAAAAGVGRRAAQPGGDGGVPAQRSASTSTTATGRPRPVS